MRTRLLPFNSSRIYSHDTIILMLATADWPIPFVATHSTSPAMFRSLTSISRLLELSFWIATGWPLSRQEITGLGIPFASQTISNTVLSFISTVPDGVDVTIGESEFEEMSIIQAINIVQNLNVIITLNFNGMQLRVKASFGHNFTQIFGWVLDLNASDLQTAVAKQRVPWWRRHFGPQRINYCLFLA